MSMSSALLRPSLQYWQNVRNPTFSIFTMVYRSFPYALAVSLIPVGRIAGIVAVFFNLTSGLPTYGTM